MKNTMKNTMTLFPFTCLALLLAPLTAIAADTAAKPEVPVKATDSGTAVKALALLADDKLKDIANIEVNGENPRLIYIPIVHDTPKHLKGAEENDDLEKILRRGQIISEHLFTNYGVRKILLEDMGKDISDQYNAPKPENKRSVISGGPDMIVYKVWLDLLNANRWQLVPAFEEDHSGPLTILGAEYSGRILTVLDEAATKGWFKTYDALQANTAAFTTLMNNACDGYNTKRQEILKADPGLKNEYDITCTQRNKVFIDNILKTEEPGIIMCGSGHVQDLIDQLKKRGVSYLIVVPKGIDWPPVKKDNDLIYSDMLKLGCTITECRVPFSDGSVVEIKIPIEYERGGVK